MYFPVMAPQYTDHTRPGRSTIFDLSKTTYKESRYVTHIRLYQQSPFAGEKPSLQSFGPPFRAPSSPSDVHPRKPEYPARPGKVQGSGSRRSGFLVTRHPMDDDFGRQLLDFRDIESRPQEAPRIRSH